jgi:hypothetical protein
MKLPTLKASQIAGYGAAFCSVPTLFFDMPNQAGVLVFASALVCTGLICIAIESRP